MFPTRRHNHQHNRKTNDPAPLSDLHPWEGRFSIVGALGDTLATMLRDGRPKRNINRSGAFRNYIAEVELKVDITDHKDFFVGGLYDIALEHHRALNVLLMYEASSSAYALLRTFIETSYRCIWLQTCADEAAVKRIIGASKKSFPDMSRIITALVNSSGVREFETELPTKDLLNDLTHTGVAQIARHIQKVADKRLCFEQDVMLCLHHADFVLVFLAISFHSRYAKVPNASDLQEKFMALRRSYELPKDASQP